MLSIMTYLNPKRHSLTPLSAVRPGKPVANKLHAALRLGSRDMRRLPDIFHPLDCGFVFGWLRAHLLVFCIGNHGLENPPVH